jgi:hypothetical protein
VANSKNAGDVSRVSTNSIIRKSSKFRPISKPLSNNNLNMLRLSFLIFIAVLLVIPILFSTSPSNSSLYLEENNGFQPSATLFHYTLPGSSSIDIATGTVQGYHGFAYVIDDEDKLYFVDIINGITLDISLPAGDQDSGSGIIAYDVDNDGDSEFLIRNYVNSQYYILLVDINDARVSQYPIPFNSPAVVGLGNFSGDAYPDALVKNVNSNNNFMTLDLFGNATIGQFLANYSYSGVIIGKFASLTEDSIAFVNQAGTTLQRNLTLVAADGSQIQSIPLASAIQDMVTFDWHGGLEEIATIQSNGYIVVYSGPSLGVAYTQNVDPLSSSYRSIQTGDFNSDPQEDLLVISRNQETAYFRDGNSGVPIRETSGIYIASEKRQDVGLMDSDTLDDVAVGTTDGALGIIRGGDGKFAYKEHLIDVRAVALQYQIKTIDVNLDSRMDVVCRVLGDVYLLVSDTTPPTVVQLPIEPSHPTILDDYVTIKVQVDEASGIEYADIFVKLQGTGIWTQPQDEMYASHHEGLYYAFIGNLQTGIYEYYLEFQDTYLNTRNIGNSTNPLSFNVKGDFVWKVDKSHTDYVTPRAHQSDIGNLSDGQHVIYTIERETGVEDLTLTQYSNNGIVLDSVTIVNTGYSWQYFEVYTAMLDGDNVADVITLDYYSKGTPSLGYHAFHGSNLSLIGEGICPYYYKSFNYLGIIDDDGDGNQELLLVCDTNPLSLIKMDSDTSWSEVDLTIGDAPQAFSVINSPSAGDGYIAILRGNLAIDIHNAGDLSFIRSLDISFSAYSDQVAVGLWSRYNSVSLQEEFVAAVNYWNGSNPIARVFIFDSTTTNINDTSYYAIPHESITYVYPHDAVGSGTDELFILLSSGELRLTSAAVSLTTLWSTSVTGATPLSAAVADFDGDSRDEFLLFTDQDELLTSVSFSGEVEWTVKVGEVRNPLVIGDIDIIPGAEIAAYPFASINSMILGAVRDLGSSYLLDVSMAYSATDLIQGATVQVNVTVQNIYGEIITDANVFVTSHFLTPEGLGANSYGFFFSEATGKYSGLIDVTWPLGTVDMSISVDNGFYRVFSQFYTDVLTVRSDLHIDLQVPDIVQQGTNTSFRAIIFDNRGGVVDGAYVTISIDGVDYSTIISGQVHILNIPEMQLLAGPHIVVGRANHPFALAESVNSRVFSVQVLTESLVISTNFETVIRQGALVQAWFNITDAYGHSIVGAQVALRSGPRTFGMIESPTNPGCYRFSNILNLGFGEQSYDLYVEKPNIIGPPARQINFTILGVLQFFTTFYPEQPSQGDQLIISILVVDSYGNPVPNLDVFVTAVNMPTIRAEETDQIGRYEVFIEHLPTTEGYGKKNVSIEASGQFVQPSDISEVFYLDVANPDIGVLDAQTAFSFTGISFAISLIGMFVYFRLAPSLRKGGLKKEELQKSVKRMDRLYVIIVLTSAIGIVASVEFYSLGQYAAALILTVALLGASVLLYGLWLYRDAVSAVMVKGVLSKKRMIAGLWHLFFVPVVIIMILNYGAEINWFKKYMIDQAFEIGGFSIPSIVTTIFVAYVSSILVVVVNLYREVSNGLKKLKRMQDANTPGPIIEDEKDTMVRRFSSSIRIKFLMFLVVVGAAAVTTMDFLQSYELGVIVLMPVAFLVVIPFISSKIVQAVNRASKTKVKETEEPVTTDANISVEESATDTDIDSIDEKKMEIEPSDEGTESDVEEDS